MNVPLLLVIIALVVGAIAIYVKVIKQPSDPTQPGGQPAGGLGGFADKARALGGSIPAALQARQQAGPATGAPMQPAAYTADQVPFKDDVRILGLLAARDSNDPAAIEILRDPKRSDPNNFELSPDVLKQLIEARKAAQGQSQQNNAPGYPPAQTYSQPPMDPAPPTAKIHPAPHQELPTARILPSPVQAAPAPSGNPATASPALNHLMTLNERRQATDGHRNPTADQIEATLALAEAWQRLSHDQALEAGTALQMSHQQLVAGLNDLIRRYTQYLQSSSDHNHALMRLVVVYGPRFKQINGIILPESFPRR